MNPAKNPTYPFLRDRALWPGSPEALRRECERLRRENASLREFGKQAERIAAEIALNPFAELDELRPRASRLLALTRQRRLGN